MCIRDRSESIIAAARANAAPFCLCFMLSSSQRKKTNVCIPRPSPAPPSCACRFQKNDILDFFVLLPYNTNRLILFPYQFCFLLFSFLSEEENHGCTTSDFLYFFPSNLFRITSKAQARGLHLACSLVYSAEEIDARPAACRCHRYTVLLMPITGALSSVHKKL